MKTFQLNCRAFASTLWMSAESHRWVAECGPVQMAPGWWQVGVGSSALPDLLCWGGGTLKSRRQWPRVLGWPSARTALLQSAHTVEKNFVVTANTLVYVQHGWIHRTTNNNTHFVVTNISVLISSDDTDVKRKWHNRLKCLLISSRCNVRKPEFQVIVKQQLLRIKLPLIDLLPL